MHISEASGRATKWSGNKWAGVSCFPRLNVNSSAVVLRRPPPAHRFNRAGLRLRSTFPLIDGDVCANARFCLCTSLCACSPRGFCPLPLNARGQTSTQRRVKACFVLRFSLTAKAEAKNSPLCFYHHGVRHRSTSYMC